MKHSMTITSWTQVHDRSKGDLYNSFFGDAKCRDYIRAPPLEIRKFLEFEIACDNVETVQIVESQDKSAATNQ